MSPAPTVVINCAGKGRRLGGNLPKSLVELGGRRLIDRQLDLLEDVDDLRIVVGFEASRVIDAVMVRRRDAIFIFNRDFANTATGDSLLLASAHIPGDLISLDGDLVIDSTDFGRLLDTTESVIGVSAPQSEMPVYVEVGDGAAVAFSSRPSQFEWTGLLRLPAARLNRVGSTIASPRHVYHLLEPLLPLSIIEVNARDIDTPADLAAAEAWLGCSVSGEPYAG